MRIPIICYLVVEVGMMNPHSFKLAWNICRGRLLIVGKKQRTVI